MSNKTVYVAADGSYRYSYTASTEARAGKLMIRMGASKMAAFRDSVVGRRVGRFVDIFAQGNGWYEITDNEDAIAVIAERFGVPAKGLISWLREFNLSQISKVDANPKLENIQYRTRLVFDTKKPVHKQVSPNQLQMLAAHFANTHHTNHRRI